MNPGNYKNNLLGGPVEQKDGGDASSPKRPPSAIQTISKEMALPKLIMEEEKQPVRP